MAALAGGINTGTVGAAVSAGGRAVAEGGGAPQAKPNPNIAGKTMMETARIKIDLLINATIPLSSNVQRQAIRYQTLFGSGEVI